MNRFCIREAPPPYLNDEIERFPKQPLSIRPLDYQLSA